MGAQLLSSAQCNEVLQHHKAATFALPRRQETELHRLWIAAGEAEKALRDYVRTSLPVQNDRTLSMLENAAWDAEQALRAHLLSEHGLTSADLRRSVL